MLHYSGLAYLFVTLQLRKTHSVYVCSHPSFKASSPMLHCPTVHRLL